MATASQTSFNGVTYSTTVVPITGLLAAGSNGINHGKCKLQSPHRDGSKYCASIGIATDGIVKLLTVTIL
jgi:hypothetical protein